MSTSRTIYLDGGFAYQTTAPERDLPAGTEDATLSSTTEQKEQS